MSPMIGGHDHLMSYPTSVAAEGPVRTTLPWLDIPPPMCAAHGGERWMRPGKYDFHVECAACRKCFAHHEEWVSKRRERLKAEGGWR